MISLAQTFSLTISTIVVHLSPHDFLEISASHVMCLPTPFLQMYCSCLPTSYHTETMLAKADMRAIVGSLRVRDVRDLRRKSPPIAVSPRRRRDLENLRKECQASESMLQLHLHSIAPQLGLQGAEATPYPRLLFQRKSFVNTWPAGCLPASIA
jgi:hypothetical protein